MSILTKLKFKRKILKSSNKAILYKFFSDFFFHLYVKMSKNLLAKNIIKKIKKDYKKNAHERY